MSEHLKREGSDEYPIETGRMRISENEMKVMSLCDSLRVAGINDEGNEISKSCREKDMEKKI